MVTEAVLSSSPAPEVRSPFLTGTNIQFAWDSTSLELLKRCPRLYQYVMIEGWQPRGEAIHLRFGIEYHQALHDYEVYKSLDLNHDEAVHATVKELLIRIRDWDPNPHTESEEKKSKKNLLRTVVWYLEKFKDDAAKTVMLQAPVCPTCDGSGFSTSGTGYGDVCGTCGGQKFTGPPKPAIEVSFRFELDWGPEEGLKIEPVEDGVRIASSQPYLLSGHLDRVVNYLGGLFVMDRKTSVYSLTTYYFNQYHPHNQMSLYTLAGKVVLESPIRGVIIDAAHVHEDYSDFQRGVTYRTQDQIDEWLDDLRYWLSEAERYATEGRWPMNDTACDKYGGCKFREICQKSPKARPTFLKNDFTQLPQEERWNPLKPR